MSSSDSIVDVTITIQDLAPARPSFGIPMLIGYHAAWADVFHKLYATAADMLSDGFVATDYLYKAAVTLTSQSPSVKQFMIGRRAAALTQTIKLTPTVTTQGVVYSGTIAGQPFTYTNGGSESVTSIGAALAALIDPFTSVAATAASGVVTCVASTPGAPLDYSVSANLTVLDNTADTTTATTLAAIDAELDGQTTSWYGVTVCDSTSKATALLVAAYVESLKKIAVVQSPDSACGDPASTTDTMYALQAATYTRTGAFFHGPIGGTEWLAVGILGGRLAVDPGVETWAFRPVAGVTVDKPKAAFKSAIDAKNGNVYIPSHSTNITWEGKAASGRYLDTTRFIDWQLSMIDFDTFVEMATPPKEPYTQRGLSSIGLVIKAAILKGVRVGGVDGDAPITVTVPSLAGIGASDVAARVVPASSAFTFGFRLTGALHGVAIRGTAGFSATA